MPIFYRPRDIATLKNISSELILKIIDNLILYVKINTLLTELNIYGLAKKSSTTGKRYFKSIKLHVLILHNQQSYLFVESIRVSRNVRFKFLNTTLQLHNVYPLIGDVIIWSRQFYLITSVTQLQLIAGQSQILWSKVCLSTLMSKSKTLKISGFITYESL